MKSIKLLGNDRIKEAARRGSLGSAVIFDGPFGTGKKAAAAYAAAALLCRAHEGERPCGKCRSCVQAMAGSHPDIIFFNEAGENIKVGDIRGLRMQSFMAPGQSSFKVIVINRADLMNQEAQNALLKVLEEPVSTVFILLTENALSLLQTVRSRCVIYAMEALDTQTVYEALKQLFTLTGKKVPEDRLRQAALASGGSIGQGIALAESGETRADEAAAVFLSSLWGGELKIMEACLKASVLNRAEYGDFCAQVTEGLVKMALDKPDRGDECVAVYEYIQGQRDKLTDNNASVFALSSQLAVFCGRLNRR